MTVLVGTVLSGTVLPGLGVVAALGDTDCETLRDGWLAQPANAVSSFAFVAVGALVLRGARRAGQPGPAPRVLGSLLVAVGVGSVAYHGPQPPGARLVHDVPIVALVAFLVVAEAAARRQGPWPVPRDATVAMLACAGAAGVSYVLGRTASPLCDPAGVLQFHALWHGFSAAAVGLWALRLHSPA